MVFAEALTEYLIDGLSETRKMVNALVRLTREKLNDRRAR